MQAFNLASLSTNFSFFFQIFGPRFQNWDLRIRPLGGNFTENRIFKSIIANSNVQRSKIRKIDPRFFELFFVVFLILFFSAAERLAQIDLRVLVASGDL